MPAFGDPDRDPATRTAVERAVEVLVAGGTVVLPTDTVYGVAAQAAQPHAVASVFRFKDRPDVQPLAVLVADMAGARQLASWDDPAVDRVMAAHWPGALTLVLPRNEAARALQLGGSPETVGIRCPGSAVARAIARATGPIATTSANRHRQPTPHTAAEAAASLAGEVGLVVDGGPCRQDPSTVVDTTASPWRILRAGPVILGEG